jgi:predicted nucleic acid-binding protein
MSKSHHFLIPTEMEAQFDAFFMNVASQCSSIASNEHTHGINAIDIMHEAYFGFLRRKTDFFSRSSSTNEEEKNRGKTSVLKALEKQREEVEKSKTTFEREKEETEKRKHKEMVKKKEREEEMREKIAEEERERKERVREALMAQKMEEAKKKIVELDEDGNEVICNDEEEEKDEQQKVARENTKKVEKEEEDPHALQPGTVHPSPLNGGEAEHYVWSQTLQEVDVRLPVPVGTRAKDIVCEFTATTFKFGLKSEPALRIPEKSKLCESIKPDDSFWTLEDNREVRLTLTKSNQMSWWENVIKGDPRIDTKKVVPENSNLADLDGETRSTVEKMMYDQRQKAAGKPTSDQESKMGLMKKFMESHPEMDFSNCKFDDGVLPAGAFNGQ